MIIRKIQTDVIVRSLQFSGKINFTNPISLIAGTHLQTKRQSSYRQYRSTGGYQEYSCMNFTVHAFDFILFLLFNYSVAIIPSISFSRWTNFDQNLTLQWVVIVYDRDSVGCDHSCFNLLSLLPLSVHGMPYQYHSFLPESMSYLLQNQMSALDLAFGFTLCLDQFFHNR